MTQQAQWFDGEVAITRPVTVIPSQGSLTLVEADGREHRIAAADLTRIGDAPGRIKLGHRSIEGWRLDLTEPVDPRLLALLRRRGFGGSSGVGRTTMAAAITVTAAGTLALGLLIVAPETVARHMPMAWEERIGSIYDLPFGAVGCSDPAAREALHNLVDRLDPKARDEGLTIELLDVDEANAAALPGQRMIILNGLFEEVENSDALAGIVAHEIAHVRRRHVATAMVRELGMGTVVTLLGGGAVASGSGSFLSLRFTRGAEAEADSDAIDMLRRAGIDPSKTKGAFDRFRALELDLPAWASSHPPSAERGARFAAAHDPTAIYRPALDPDATKALFTACAEGPAKPRKN